MKICLAGSINKDVMAYVDTLPDNSLSILQSFIDYRKASQLGINRMKTLLQKSSHFMLDSGAYSMIYGNKQVELETYIADYIQFVKEWDIQHYIELDLYDIIGVKETEQIRARLEREIGRPSIPVFHRSLKKDYFLQLTKDYDYIGVGGLAVAGRGGYNVSLFRKLNEMAAENNCKVHGLGYTTMKHLDKTKFYSVDSTSWLAPLRFGGWLHYFDNGEIRKMEIPAGKKLNSMAIATYQFKEWLKYQKYADTNFHV